MNSVEGWVTLHLVEEQEEFKEECEPHKHMPCGLPVSLRGQHADQKLHTSLLLLSSHSLFSYFWEGKVIFVWAKGIVKQIVQTDAVIMCINAGTAPHDNCMILQHADLTKVI